MSQGVSGWVLHKGLLQGLESLLVQSAPVKRGLFLKKPSEGHGQGGKAEDECSIVVGEPKESLDVGVANYAGT